MTGFGAAEGEVRGRRMRVEVRTVNHRWFNVAVHLPHDLASVEPELREALRRRFDRGHVTVGIHWVAEPRLEAGLDVERAEIAATALRQLQARLQLDGSVTLDLVLRHAAAMGGDATGAAVEWPAIGGVVDRAIDACVAMRDHEGAALANELSARLAAFEQVVESMARRAPERLVRERDRLADNLRQLLGDRAADDARVAMELALAADRLDITEELVRLRAHVDAARAALGGTAPVGKSLGFLAQEIGREVNTIGSKANDVEIAHAAVHLKGELEKLREQADNLE